MKLTNEIVIKNAKALGFDLVGFAQAEELNNEAARLKEWLDKGYHHKMSYMERNFDKRRNVRTIFPEARSVISLALNYYIDDKHSGEKGYGKISRYAWGKDYHLVMWEKLFEFVENLREVDPEFNAVTYVDTGPVMDKAWAVKAGIGWMGKNTNVISNEIGSWFFIATVITNRDFEYNKPVPDLCGTCTACLDACPTGALTDEYILDANKCISNLTIENRGDIPDEFKGKFDNWIYGCDICQEVCPYNKKFARVTGEKEFKSTHKEILLTDVFDMTKSEFNKHFQDSPIKRTRPKGLRRNAGFLIE